MKSSTDTGRLTMDIQVRVKDGSGKPKILNGLLDTGATGIFCKETILKNIDHKKYKAVTKISGRYKSNYSHAKAKFKV